MAVQTPMMRQYESLKKEHPDAVLLFRMGDFYECFQNDAKLVAKVLGITLTGRGKDENRIPMAGIPYHALSQYLPKLIAAGLKIAIAEQTEQPQAGKLVDRKIVKIITPGTVMDEKSLPDDENNHLAAVFSSQKRGKVVWGISYTDISTGAFFVGEFVSAGESIPEQCIHELFRIRPAEVLVKQEDDRSRSALMDVFSTSLLDEMYTCTPAEAERTLKDHTGTNSLKGFGIEEQTAGQIAAALLIKYVQTTQKTDLNHLRNIKRISFSQNMILDQSTIRNLELIYPMRSDGDMQQTLYGVINGAKTAMGQRLLRSWVLRPLLDLNEITKRLGAVELLKESSQIKSVREKLAEIPDLERVTARISTGSANARDLRYLATGLQHTADVTKQLSALGDAVAVFLPQDSLCSELVDKVVNLIDKSISQDPPITITEGEIIAEGYSAELDTLKKAQSEGKEFIRNLQKQEIESTGISSLKVKFNKVFGYYIEVSKSNLDKVPDNYVRKQTLVNAERFITDELKKWEEQVLGAEEKAAALEYKLFEEVRQKVLEHVSDVLTVSERIAAIDVIAGFAYKADVHKYIKPNLSESGGTEITGGRHPVVEQFTEADFISNDTIFNETSLIHLITGPNMSGKSTYIRQVALLVLMAQIGSFVPADHANIAIADRVFTRVGASDNLASGESTFMVEMNETANILNNATDRSVVILDEVGRGTSTFDGIAIARAIIEYLAQKLPARTLFATHYHELTGLEGVMPGVVNRNVQVKEHKGKILFMHKIIEGATDKSYGIHVAELAGVPDAVTKRANELLTGFETQKGGAVRDTVTQLSFDTAKQESQIEAKLKTLALDNMTPLEALSTLHDLQSEL